MKLPATLVSIVYLFYAFLSNPVEASTSRLWEITSVDTMKISRDSSADPAVFAKIPDQVTKVKELGASHIAIGTPYDERFIPILTAWVREARKQNISIWFRGNFSGWEGWFDTPKFTDPRQHHTKTYAFIISHPELFRVGDIFTPVPEPENGMIGDPRSTGKVAEFNQFLIDSYQNCESAFQTINIPVRCGLFSTNGDIAREIITPETVKQIGNVIVVDHYVKNNDQLVSDLQLLHQKFNAPVILGEVGAPVPDLQGVLTEQAQSDYIADMFHKLYQINGTLEGINYWILSDGSTAIINHDGTLRKAYTTIQDYYSPITVQGVINDEFGDGIREVEVKASESASFVKTDRNGNFSYTIPKLTTQLQFAKERYIPQTLTIQPQEATRAVQLVMHPSKEDFRYKLKKIFEKFKNYSSNHHLNEPLF